MLFDLAERRVPETMTRDMLIEHGSVWWWMMCTPERPLTRLKNRWLGSIFSAPQVQDLFFV